MILDLSTINFVGGGGESSAPAGKVETVEVNITMNGVENPTLNEGFSAFGDVTVNSDNVENSSALLFTKIGYSEELNTELNAKYNADIAYSKELLDKWNNGEISNFEWDKKLVYCPKIDTSTITNLGTFFRYCSNLQFIPYLETFNCNYMGGMFYGCSSLTSIPEINTENVTNMNVMFNECGNLQYIPYLETSQVTNMSQMFSACSSLTSIPEINTSACTNMSGMFTLCRKLQYIPYLETSQVTTMSNMFKSCDVLTSIPEINTENVTKVNGMFEDCKLLQSIPLLDFGKVTDIGRFLGWSNIYSLTDLGGFAGLKIDWNDSNGLAICPNLTYQSVMNVLNNLYDFKANGDDTTTKTLKLHSNSYNLLSADDIAMANNKGWNITT